MADTRFSCSIDQSTNRPDSCRMLSQKSERKSRSRDVWVRSRDLASSLMNYDTVKGKKLNSNCITVILTGNNPLKNKHEILISPAVMETMETAK